MLGRVVLVNGTLTELTEWHLSSVLPFTDFGLQGQGGHCILPGVGGGIGSESGLADG